MLNRHPEIAISPETDFNHYVHSRRRSFGSLSDPQNRQRLVDAYLSTEHVRKMKVDLHALQETLLREGTSYETFFVSLLRFYAQAQGKKRWGEKTPRHALIAETLCDWYPSATIIHLVRDPRDVVASLLRLPGTTNNVLGSAYVWLHCNLGARQSYDRPQYLLVRYEELVLQPEQELRRICAVLGAEYSPVMLLPNCDPATVLPWYRRAEEPVTTERLGKWREELTPDNVALVEWIVGPHMQLFGYEVVGRSPTSLAIFRGAAFAAFDALKRRIAEFPASWYYITRSTNLLKEENARHRFRKRYSTRVN
jgi:Sulfotransferase family